MEILLSGFAGALIAQVLSIGWSEIKRRREYRSLLVGILAECDYNLSIVDEILNGAVNHKGSFKRMSVDFFRSAREGAVKYSMARELIRTLSRAIIDLELFNLEANYIFSGDENRFFYAGAIDEKPILIERRPKEYDITNTITHARLGVTNTLNDLKKLANRALHGDEE
jgi:hypothetical protein